MFVCLCNLFVWVVFVLLIVVFVCMLARVFVYVCGYVRVYSRACFGFDFVYACAFCCLCV